MNARVIDHQQAIKNMMAEHYLLGELNENERDAFEAHLFECSDCFEQVKAGTEFVNSLKKIGAEEAGAVSQSGWRHALARWFQPKPALVFAVMFLCAAGFNIYQELLLHQMSAPEVVAVQTLRPEARGGSNVVLAPRRGAFELRVLIQSTPGLKLNRAQILNDAGKEIASFPVKSLRGDELQIRLRAAMFRPGSYVLVVKAIDPATARENVLDQYPFELMLQD